MKATINKQKLARGLKAVITAVLLMVSVQTNKLKAQESVIGINLKSTSSMDGLGTSFVPELSFSKGRHQFSAGVNIQKRQTNFSGGRLGYTFIINPGDDAQVFLLAETSYYNKALLGNQMLRMENRINPESSNYFNSVRINVAGQYIGFGVKIFNNSPVNLVTSIAGGMYHTWGFSETQVFGYRDLTDASVMVSLAVNVKLYAFK